MGNETTIRKRIGFTAGSWDLLHAGHVAHFEEAKTYCDYLIVGLQTDPSLDRPNKNKPIQSLEERYRVLRSNKNIDAIIVYEREEELKKIDLWLPVDFRFTGIEYKGKYHYPTKAKFIYLVGDDRYHSSELRKRIGDNPIRIPIRKIVD